MKFVKPLLIVFSILALGLGAFFLYRWYTQVKEDPIDALYFIPDNAAFVISTKDYPTLMEELRTNSKIVELFANDSLVNQSIIQLDTLIKNIVLSDLLEEEDFKTYFSLHFTGINRFEGLISFSFNQTVQASTLQDFLANRGKITPRKFEGFTIYSFVPTNSQIKYYIVLHKSALSISTYEPLAEKMILEIKAKAIEKKKKVDKLLKVSGKEVDASVFINYQYFYRLVASMADSRYNTSLSKLGNLSQFSVLDLSYDSTCISLNGLTFSIDSTANYLNTYKGYHANRVDIFNHCPASTSFIYYQGANQLGDYLNHNANSMLEAENIKSLDEINKSLKLDLRDYFYPWIKSEMSLCLIDSKTEPNTYDRFALMNTYDPKEALNALDQISKLSAQNQALTLDSNIYRGYSINQINIPYLLQIVFGEMYGEIEHSFYTEFNGYIIFANTPNVITNYIDDMLIEKTLAKREGFSSFYEKMNPESNVLVYANLNKSKTLILPKLSQKMRNYFDNTAFNLEDFGDFSVQFIVNEDDIYTSINLSTSNTSMANQGAAWQVALDNEVVSGPFLVENADGQTADILVFDKQNIMHRINNQGLVLWSVPVSELPLGSVETVDYYRNGQRQFIFNSAKFIYLFDSNGNRVEKYQIALKSEATASLSIVDYDKDHNYRVLVPQSDGKVHNYMIDGSETKGWLLPAMPKAIRSKVQYYRLEGADFLLISDLGGNIAFANRKGETRMQARLAFTPNPNTSFYQLNNRLITTDPGGRLVIVSSDGGVEKHLFREFSTSHYFMLIDVDLDGQSEFLFYDIGVLYVYNQDFTLKWTATIPNILPSTIQSSHGVLQDSTSLILYDSERQVYLFGNGIGLFLPHDEFSASANFLLIKPRQSEFIRFITVKGKVISNYLIN
jgi:hypothetical protein